MVISDYFGSNTKSTDSLHCANGEKHNPGAVPYKTPKTVIGFRTAALTDLPHALCGKSFSVKIWAVINSMELSSGARQNAALLQKSSGFSTENSSEARNTNEG